MEPAGETIAAIATAPGRGGVAVIRVSGPDACDVAEKVTGRPVGDCDGGTDVGPLVRVARFRSPADGEVLDSGVLLVFRAPRSYTGEDVVEFQCHGGAVVPRRVLAACFAAGARLARRGEFTERAFLNGKLDFGQAESVLALIDAKTDRAAAVAFEELSGRKRRTCRALYDLALSASTDVEHALDIDEGELPEGFFGTLSSRIARLASEVRAAIRRAREGKILREGALVVLVGPPNAGKSSLMNALLEENRAIVSDVPGTTRDAIEESLDLDGWPVRIVDTAGLRETGDRIEAEGVRRAEDLMTRADIILELCPAGESASFSRVPAAVRERVLSVSSKSDLGRGTGLNVSVRTGEGLDALKAAIVARLSAASAADAGGGSSDDRALATFLEVEAVLTDLPTDDLVLIGNGLRHAADRLGDLVGATYSDDLLERLFSRFCVGK